MFGYFYEKLPFRDVLNMIPICLLFLGAIFSGISNMYAYNPFGENMEFSKKRYRGNCDMDKDEKIKRI